MLYGSLKLGPSKAVSNTAVTASQQKQLSPQSLPLFNLRQDEAAGSRVYSGSSQADGAARHKTRGKWEMERETVTVNLNDNMHTRDMNDPQSLPLIAVLPWVSQNCSCPAAVNTSTVNSCLLSDFYTNILPNIPTVTANVMLVYS